MEIKVNLASQVQKLVIDAQNVLEKKKVQQNTPSFDNDFLLSVPRMSEQQYEEFLENRKQFNQWRKK